MNRIQAATFSGGFLPAHRQEDAPLLDGVYPAPLDDVVFHTPDAELQAPLGSLQVLGHRVSFPRPS
jgi:hypothetical protein